MKKALIAIVLLLFSLTVSTSALTLSHAQETNPNFSDHFDGTTIDPTKWTVQENTNMSGYPAYGGSVQIANSTIILSSTGSSFPCVYSATNPFPTTGDFAVEFDFTYSHISDFGDGIWITSGPQLTIPPSGLSSSTLIFQLWADNNQSFTRVKLMSRLLSKEVWLSYVNGWEPDAPTHTFKLEYVNGVYTLYVDQTEVASAQSQVRPNSIGFGHPPIYYVPFSAEHLRTLMGGWTRFKIDYIRMVEPTNKPSNTPAPTGAPTGVPTSLKISTSAESAQLGFSVDINGTLTNQKGTPLPDANVLLSYRIPGVPAWNTFTSTTTDKAGAFAVTWLPTATGNFIIKAEYNGDETHSGSADAKNISVVRGTKQSLLYAESNSTLSSLSLNSTSNEISFTVSGPSGTTGYVKFLISKELLSNVTDLKVYIDGQQAEYTVASVGNLQSLFFSYGHSTHAITIKLPETAAVPEFPAWILLPLLIASTLFAVAFGKKNKTALLVPTKGLFT